MIRKLAVVGAIVTGVVVLIAGPAFAHVEIERDGDVGADGVVATTLHVPNEETNAGTVKVELVFPESPALNVATPGAVNGWTATVQKTPSGQVTGVTWIGGPLTGDQEVAFPLSLGTIPANVKTVEFKALQTYNNGTVVRWIEVTPAGGSEPEHPAPVLTARGAQPAGDGAAAQPDTATTKPTTKSSSDDGLSTGAIVAIAIGVIIVLALLGFILSRTRRNMRSPTD
jgi:uncharacterized protein YcnI